MKKGTLKNDTSSEFSGMNVHEFGIYLKENYHLYSDEERIILTDLWISEYENYLIEKVKPLMFSKI